MILKGLFTLASLESLVSMILQKEAFRMGDRDCEALSIVCSVCVGLFFRRKTRCVRFWNDVWPSSLPTVFIYLVDSWYYFCPCWFMHVVCN